MQPRAQPDVEKPIKGSKPKGLEAKEWRKLIRRVGDVLNERHVDMVFVEALIKERNRAE